MTCIGKGCRRHAHASCAGLEDDGAADGVWECASCAADRESRLCCAVCGGAGDGTLVICDRCGQEGVHLRCIAKYNPHVLGPQSLFCARCSSARIEPYAEDRLVRTRILFKPGTSVVERARVMQILSGVASELEWERQKAFLDAYVDRRLV